MAWLLECSPMVWETGVQSQVESYQWLQKIVLDASLLHTRHFKVRASLLNTRHFKVGASLLNTRHFKVRASLLDTRHFKVRASLPNTRHYKVRASLLNTRHYKVRIKGNVGQSKRPPLHLGVEAIEKGASNKKNKSNIIWRG